MVGWNVCVLPGSAKAVRHVGAARVPEPAVRISLARRLSNRMHGPGQAGVQPAGAARPRLLAAAR